MELTIELFCFQEVWFIFFWW